MNTELLSKMLRDLLREHDSVNLPSLGTFVTEIEPASFSDKGYTINPPYRRLSFRSRQSDDTLLADLYSASNSIPREQAVGILSKFLLEVAQNLRNKKVVVLPGLGKLRATRQNTFFFIQDEDLDLFPEGFGLAPVSMKANDETKTQIRPAMEAAAEPVQVDTEETPVEEVQTEETEVEEAPVKETPVEETPVTEETPTTEEVPVEEEIQTPEEVPAAEEIAKGVHEAGTPKTPARKKGWLKAIGWTFAAAAALLALLAIGGRLAPGIVDHVLYNSEDYALLHK